MAVAVAVVAGGLALAYARRDRPRPVTRERGLSVLLITVDTLRADALGSYGRVGAGTPVMDRLAAGGVRFEQAHAQNVVTLPSHANILSGRYPLDHGIRDNSGFRFPKDADTLATLLKKQGYRTGAFVSAFPLDSRFGLDRGFDVYDDRFGDRETHQAFVMQERRGPETVAAARAWIDAQPDPYFAWVHLYEPHFPYEPPGALAQQFSAEPYQGEVAAADAALAPLLAPLLEGRRRALVVLTADHGESLGEHGEKTHGIFAYEGTLHVPLVFHEPRLFAPSLVRERVRHVDIVPTVLDALALDVPPGLAGRSLLATAAGHEESAEPSYFEALSAATNRGWAPLTGTAKGEWKYIDLPVPELYDLAKDPHEAHNLVSSRPKVLSEMRSLLAAQRARDRGISVQAESPETLERLRSLGYAASGGKTLKERYTEADDPKRLIELDTVTQDVISLYQSGDMAGALRLCEELVRRRPNMALSLLHLAFLQRESGDLAGAVESSKKAFLLNTEDPDSVALLGVNLNEAGRAQETVALLRPYADRPDPDLDILMALGVGLAQAGKPKEAIAVFEKARSADPSNAMALANIGTVYLTERDYAKATRAMEAALALDPGIARAHNALGVIAAENGRLDEAVGHWRKAVETDPREYDTLFNLGKLLMKQGRGQEARPYLERFAREAPISLHRESVREVEGWLRSLRAGP